MWEREICSELSTGAYSTATHYAQWHLLECVVLNSTSMSLTDLDNLRTRLRKFTMGAGMNASLAGIDMK